MSHRTNPPERPVLAAERACCAARSASHAVAFLISRHARDNVSAHVALHAPHVVCDAAAVARLASAAAGGVVRCGWRRRRRREEEGARGERHEGEGAEPIEDHAVAAVEERRQEDGRHQQPRAPQREAHEQIKGEREDGGDADEADAEAESEGGGSHLSNARTEHSSVGGSDRPNDEEDDEDEGEDDEEPAAPARLFVPGSDVSDMVAEEGWLLRLRLLAGEELPPPRDLRETRERERERACVYTR